MLKWILGAFLAVSGMVSAETKILVFAGSTREDSMNKKLARAASEVAQQMGDYKVTLIDLREYPIPLYDGDVEAKYGMPENAKKIRRLMLQSDAIIIASPEYNGSISGALKNVIDWASRNENGQASRDAFKGKRFAIMTAAPSGGASGLSHLRSIIQRIGGCVVKKEVSIKNDQGFNAQGQIVDAALKGELKEEIQQLFSQMPECPWLAN